MSEILWSAFALVLVIEGLLPFFSPRLWRQVFEQALQLSDGQLRFIGLSSMLLGLSCWSSSLPEPVPQRAGCVVGRADA